MVRTKKVNRYWCDFCNKAGLSASHMKHHEEHCTKNPNRKCGVCKMLEQEPASIPAMLSVLPDPGQFIGADPNPDIDHETMNDLALYNALKEVFPRLREITGECPACIMAALRQKGIPVPVCGDLFDYKKELAAVWESVNEAALERESSGYRQSVFYG